MTPEEREKMMQEKAEKKASEKAEKGKDKPQKKISTKKLKGKDWYTIISPPEFGSTFLGETPSMDPKTLVGRTIDINLAEISNKPNKFHMNLLFRINNIKEKTANTEFSGFYCAREHLFRMVRKRVQKVRSIDDIVTKDNWRLQITSVIVLNRNTNAEIQKKVRKFIKEHLAKEFQKETIYTNIKGVLAGTIQKSIRKQGSRIYPIRFSEIEKIEVMQTPN